MGEKLSSIFFDDMSQSVFFYFTKLDGFCHFS